MTLDLDAVDPSEFPGTGTPEAGGLRFTELLSALLALRPLHVAAFDICELSPHYDHSGASTALACKTLREMLLAYCWSRAQIHKRRRENGSPPLSLFYNDFLLRENANFCNFSE